MPRRRIQGTPAFALAAYAFLATMLGTTLPTPLYALYQRRYGFSELTVTVIFAVYAAGVITALMLFGRVSDEAGRRPVLLAGLGLSALSAIALLRRARVRGGGGRHRRDRAATAGPTALEPHPRPVNPG